jgi:succinate dehydrogenase/fumarate reductase flavoprotein subunit
MSDDRQSDTRISTPRDVDSVKDWWGDFEVVVVGLGIAGGAAAIEALRAGAKTLVLERGTRGGGTTSLSECTIYLGGGTRVQKTNGFEDTLELMQTHVQAAAGPTADPEKVRLYCEGSLEHFDWFQGIGVEFKDSFHEEKVIFPPGDECLMFSGNEEAWPFSAESTPMPRGHKPKWNGPAGGYVMEQVIRTIGELGGRIQNETRVERLIARADGRVVGVVARQGGVEICIRARRGVILTAGGFVMNREMCRKYAPHLTRVNPVASEGDDGSGILLGVSAGGAAVNMDEGLVMTPYFPPSSHLKGVLVSAQGQRFINEDCYHARVTDAILRKADGRAFLILDDETYGKTLAPYEMAGIEESFEGLERELGIPEGNLVHTLEYYNRHAEKGEDPLFHKAGKYLKPLDAPPFAALDLGIASGLWAGFTLGGLDTRPSGEVLRATGEVVPGLYAAGRTSAGLTRAGRFYASGMSVGGGSFFGRLAGRSAARAEPAG